MPVVLMIYPLTSAPRHDTPLVASGTWTQYPLPRRPLNGEAKAPLACLRPDRHHPDRAASIILGILGLREVQPSTVPSTYLS